MNICTTNLDILKEKRQARNLHKLLTDNPEALNLLVQNTATSETPAETPKVESQTTLFYTVRRRRL